MSERTATILIVDQAAGACHKMTALLQRQGYKTVLACSGEQTLNTVRRTPPDLILLSHAMQGLSAREIALQLKSCESSARIPIIIVSTIEDCEARIACLEAGAEDWLSKPIDSPELRLKMRNLIRLKELSDYLRKHSLMLEAELLQRTIDVERFRSAMDSSSEAIFLTSRTRMAFIEINATAARLLGYTCAELRSIGPAELGELSIHQLEQIYDAVIAAPGNTAPSANRIRRKDGSYITVQVHRQAYRCGEDWIIVGRLRERVHGQSLSHGSLDMLSYDFSTGLPNRKLFYTTLQMGLSQASLNGWRLAVVTVDIDNFRIVNEGWGHFVGDQLLVGVGRRLAGCLDISDTLGRMDGDEFALIHIIRDGVPQAQVIVEKIRESLRKSFHINDCTISVTASIGIAFYPDDGYEAASLVSHSNVALNRAKGAGQDTYRFYTAQMNSNIRERLEMEVALRKAVQNKEFELFYQPKVTLSNGSVCGVEALLRWRREDNTQTSPAVFVPLLESLGLIEQVGRWVIVTVCKQISLWTRSGHQPYQVAVNVSGKQISEGDLVDVIGHTLQLYGVDARWLEIELTESSLMENTLPIIECLQRLRALGIKISIDDFGTGYSSLAYLQRFPIDKIKIDIAFIRDVTTNQKDAAIVRAIIELAHSLQLQVIAEGVETVEQLRFLKSESCDQAQGYLYSRPIPLCELEAFFDDGYQIQWVDGA
ncbi:EAL domain-containing protein [Pseudomonas sp. F3-2]|uniref:EAL domain-containing response regulator n=1 Tax=Pseudomonas sp. F3-2 TaxID=3141539 RepID=UPI00315DDB51